MRQLVFSSLLILCCLAGMAQIPVYYVKTPLNGGSDNHTGTSWNQAFATIQKAIDVAHENYDYAQVWVAEGTYYPTVLAPTVDTGWASKAIVMKPGIMLYGGFQGNETDIDQRDFENHVSTITADLNNNDGWTWNAVQYKWIITNQADNLNRCVVFYGNMGSFDLRSGLDGFTITGAKRGAIDMYVSYYFQIPFTPTECSPLITNNCIKNNYSQHSGAAINIVIYENNNSCNTIIRGNRITNNAGSAAIDIELWNNNNINNTIVIIGNNIRFNTGYEGGGISILSSTGNAENSFLLSENNISNNYASFGGGSGFRTIVGSDGVDLKFDNNLICNNTSLFDGGGIRVLNSFPTVDFNCAMRNNTIVKNKSLNGTGGGIHFETVATETSQTSVLNCIIWGNEALSHSQICNEQNTYNLYTHHSAINQGFYGIGFFDDNILLHLDNSNSLGPQFVNPSANAGCNDNGTNADWRILNACSRCVDGGNNSYVTNLGTDINGLPRIYDEGTVDMGAYEFQGFNHQPAVSFSGIQAICPGEPLFVSVVTTGGNPPFLYFWDNNDSSPNTILTTPGVHQLQITDAWGCVYVFEVEIPIAYPPIASGLQRLYVKENGLCEGNGSSWENALPAYRLQDAIDFLSESSGGEVWVAEGTYFPTKRISEENTNFRDYSFIMHPNVNLFGGFSGNEISVDDRNLSENFTILDGNRINSNDYYDYCYHVVLISSDYGIFDTTFVFDGFHVIHGNANGPGDKHSGGGIKIIAKNSLCSPNIENCKIYQNFAQLHGGGISCDGYGFLGQLKPIIRNNYLNNNSVSEFRYYGGNLAVYCELGTAEPRISNNFFTQAGGDGIAIIAADTSNISPNVYDNTICYNQYSGINLVARNNAYISGFVQNNQIYSNQNPGIYVWTESRGKIESFVEGNAISGQYKSGDTFGFESNGINCISFTGECYPKFVNNYIFNNSQAGIVIRGDGELIPNIMAQTAPVFIGNVVFNNTAQDGGGVYIRSSIGGTKPVFINNTIVNNAVNDPDGEGGGVYIRTCEAEFYNNLIWGNQAEIGSQINISSAYPWATVILKNNAAQGVIVGASLNENFYSLAVQNENSSGPHFVQPTSFKGTAQTAADSAELLLADWSINHCSNSIVFDHGNNQYAVDSLGDFNGNLRIMNGTVDLGAYENPAQNFTYIADAQFCENEIANVDLLFQGVPPFEFDFGLSGQTSSYQTNSNFYHFGVSQPGTYVISLHDPYNCGAEPESQSFTIGVLPVDTVFADTIHACAGSMVNVCGLNVSVSGTYYETLQSMTYCDSVIAYPVVFHQPPLVSASVGEAGCGVADGSISLNISGTSGSYTVLWSNGSAGELLNNLGAGVYFCTITDDYCTLTPMGYIISESGGPEFSVWGDTSACSGSQINLNASGAELFSWFNPQTSENIVGDHFSMLVLENQDVFLTGTTGNCSAITMLQLVALTVDTVHLSAETCEGSGYQFFGISPDSSGVYQQLLTNQVGCDSLIVLHLIVLPVDTVLTTEEICDGEYVYFENSNYFDEGEYSVVISGSQGCDSVRILSLIVHPQPEAPYIHEEQGIIISSETYGNQWYRNGIQIPGATTDTLFYSQTGNYYARVINEWGCTSAPSNTVYVFYTNSEIIGAMSSIAVFPNPCNGTLNIYFDPALQFTKLCIIDITGRIVMDQKLATQIDVSELVPGMYSCCLYMDYKQTKCFNIVIE